MERRRWDRWTRRTILGIAGIAAGGLAAFPGTVAAGASREKRTLMAGTDQETTLYVNDSGNPGPTAFVVGGMHGNEEAGYLAGRNLQTQMPRWGKLVVLPRANVVAIEGGTRDGPNGDLNRKFPLRADPETELAREIWNEIVSVEPHLVVDMHESVGRYQDGFLGQTLGYAPVTNPGGMAAVTIDEVNALTSDENDFVGRYLPSPNEDPTDVLVQKTAYELGVPTYIVETYDGLHLTDRVRWQRAFVRGLYDHRTWRYRAQEPRHTIKLVGSGATVSVEFTVSGSVVGTDTVDSADSVGDTTVQGEVSDGDTDHYQYTGRISSFSVTGGDSGDLAIYVDGEPKTIDEVNPSSTSQLTISGTGEWIDYQFGVDGTVTGTGTKDDHDWVFDDRVYGRVKGGSDTFEYGRDVDTFAITEGSEADVDISVDGDARTVADLDESPATELVVRGSGTAVRFEFAVSGTIWPTDSLESEDSVVGSTANGQVKSDDDRYLFTGDVLSFTVVEGDPADVTVFVDGNETSVPDLNPAAIHELRIEGTGTETQFAFEASDLVYPTATLESSDSVGVNRAAGAVTSDADRYLFRDDVVSFTVTAGSPEDIGIFVDGKETTVAALNEPISAARTLTVDDPWQTFSLSNSYDAPVVLAKPPSFAGTHPCHTRLRNVTDAGFECRIEEWEYLDGGHYEETVGSLAVESGTHTLADGTTVAVGRVVTDDSWVSVTFDRSFSVAPVVVTQAQTGRGGDSIVTRIRNVSTDGFEVRLQEEETGGAHYHETIGYVAIEPGTGSIDGTPFEATVVPDTVHDDWAGLTFERQYTDPVFVAGVGSFDGPNTCGLRYRNLTETGVEVKIEEEQSADDETGHVTEDVGYVVLGDSAQAGDTDSLDWDEVEARSLAVDDPWRTYDLANTYQSPVVLANPPSYAGPHPCHARVRNVGEGTFECRIEEWLYLDGAHYEETVGSVTVEAGSYELGDGRRVESGVVETDESWAGVSFDPALGSTPVVLTGSLTENGWQSIVTRVRNVSTGGFDVRLQEEEAEGPHVPESIGYLAIEPGVGQLADAASEAGLVVDGVTDGWQQISFEQKYTNPVFVAAVQSFDGPNTCGLRYRNLSGTGVEIMIEEEQSVDDETNHTTEDVGYLVVDG